MTNALHIDHILQNEYKIISVLGQGGFGITYLAEDINLNYKVVIKEFLPQDMATRDETRINVTPFTKDVDSYTHLLKRFSEEAQLLANMKHPNVVKVIRFFNANNTAYFVMEYAEGETLKEYLQQHKTLSEDEILSIMMPILEGAKYVHEKGFLHRDIAPDNIYLTKNGMPILIDFGAARDAIAEESKNISSIVKEGYSSPEQYTVNNHQNASSDIYAIGSVFYRLMSGKVPVNAPQRQTALLNDEPDPLGDISKEFKGKYSQALLHSVKKALNLRARDRFASVGEFQKSLLEHVVVDSSPSPVSRHVSSTLPQAKKNPQNNALLIAFLIVLFLFIAGIAYFLMNQSTDKVEPVKKETQIETVLTQKKSTKNDELEQAKKELETLRRTQAEAEQKRKEDVARKEREAEAERSKQERAEIEKLKEEKVRIQREELNKLKREKEQRERDAYDNTPREKVISFNENGIDIHVTYPNFVKAGEKFRITATMTNNNQRAKQGGLTLSFPDIAGLKGSILHNSFSLVKGYGYPDKIYNKQARKALPANYFMVEGWQSKPWSSGSRRSFAVDLVAPYDLSSVRVNLRAVLWIRNKHDIREIPSSSHVYDQQGFAVKQFSIKIK